MGGSLTFPSILMLPWWAQRRAESATTQTGSWPVGDERHKAYEKRSDWTQVLIKGDERRGDWTQVLIEG
jgi:hypothetical protein